MNYFLHLVVTLEIYVVIALSLNLLIGYGGLLQVAHAAYFGLGAYATALLTINAGLGFFPALCCAGIISGLASVLVSLPAWRFKGDCFVMISLAVQALLYSIFRNSVEITNGPFGINGIPKPAIFGSIFATHSAIAILYGAIVLFLGLIIASLKNSPFGRSLQAMRDDELAARSLGIPVRRLKVEAFMVASAMVGVAGGLYASYISYIDPTSFTLHESILMLSMVIVGGTGNVRGPLIGAAVLIAIPEILRFCSLPDTIAANVRLLAYGLLLIVLMHWRPQGLAGRYRFK